jgi:vitamin B12 transporter
MRRSAIAALSLLTASSAFAGDPLPEVVVTATRVATRPQDVAAGVTVISRADIEARGFNTLTDALADVPGVHVSPSGGLGGQASAFVRGANSDHVLVLRDGMPVTDAAEPNGAYNFGTDTLSDIERIEIVRGPMAALYGSGAIGGVINLISRRGTEAGVHWSGDLAGGYPALVRGAVSASGTQGPVDFALTAASQSQRGYDATPQRQAPYRDVPGGFRDRVVTVNLGYSPVVGTRLSLFLRAQSAYFAYNTLGGFDASFNPLPTFDNANTNGQVASLLGRVGGTTTLFDGALETAVFAGQLQGDRRYYEPLHPADPNQASSDSRYHSYRTDLQWNNTLHLDRLARVPGVSDAQLTFGTQYTGDSAKSRSTSDSAGGGYATSATGFMADYAAYAGLQASVLKRLVVSGQVRQDWVAGQSPGTWRAGAVYDLAAIATRLKASYGTGFRAPSLFDRYGTDVFGFRGNPNLRPERSEGWEAGFTTDIPALSRDDFLTLGATYFDQRVRDLIVTVFSPVYTEANVQSAHVHGIETEATLRPAPWLDVRASWTLLATRAAGQSPSVGTKLLRRPQNQGSLAVTARPLEGLRVTATLVYTGSARDYLYDNNSFGTGYGTGQHGLVANASVNYAIRPDAEVYLNGWNVLGSRFEPVNGYQMPGPTVLAGVRFRL